MEVADLDGVFAIRRSGKAFEEGIGGEDALVGGVVGLGERRPVTFEDPQLGIEIRAEAAGEHLEGKRLTRLGGEREAVGLAWAVEIATDNRRAADRHRGRGGRRRRPISGLRHRRRRRGLEEDWPGGDKHAHPAKRTPLELRRYPNHPWQRVRRNRHRRGAKRQGPAREQAEGHGGTGSDCQRMHRPLEGARRSLDRVRPVGIPLIADIPNLEEILTRFE